MTTKRHSATAPTAVGGKPTNQLASTYRDHRADPKCEAKLNRFGNELDTLLKQYLRIGSQSGYLARQEEDLRQVAAVLLFENLLSGNKKLQATVTTGLPDAVVEEEIKRSVWAAIKFACLRKLRAAEFEARLLDVFARHCSRDSGDGHAGNRAQDAARLIRAAHSKGKLSKRNRDLLLNLVLGRMTRSEAASRYNLSKAAISQIVTKATKVIADLQSPNSPQP